MAVGAVHREEHAIERASPSAVGTAHCVVFDDHALGCYGDDADAAEAAVKNRNLVAHAIQARKIAAEPTTADAHIVCENRSAAGIATADLDADAQVVELAILDDDE